MDDLIAKSYNFIAEWGILLNNLLALLVCYLSDNNKTRNKHESDSWQGRHCSQPASLSDEQLSGRKLEVSPGVAPNTLEFSPLLQEWLLYNSLFSITGGLGKKNWKEQKIQFIFNTWSKSSLHDSHHQKFTLLINFSPILLSFKWKKKAAQNVTFF